MWIFALLTSAHCFLANATAENHLVIAQCKNQIIEEWATLEIQDRKNIGVPSHDLALLRTKVNLGQGDGVRITAYPAMYFESLSRLKSGISCRILGWGLNPKGNSDHLLTLPLSQGNEKVTVKIQSHHRTLEKYIVMENFNQEPLKNHATYGDSGGALLCRTPYSVNEELIGITSTVNTHSETGATLQNSFTPVFTANAIRFLINKNTDE